eukprot:TRINITY_DN548_c0_g2_i1.p2 TRINITY_DN548_c0_g2~~TRINITY_DN548_c0_g2_i1.p2  ORF type:complete len:120 (-),score=28.74 TRINITY_DN548_c0_g2_i1:111-470(-)
MTGALQTFARKHRVPIDKLSFGYVIQPETRAPSNSGVFVHGLYIEGARWNAKEKSLADQIPGEMHEILPTVQFVPVENYKQPEGSYACPVYKTSVRAGVLSTTGQSTNFVVCIDLPTRK